MFKKLIYSIFLLVSFFSCNTYTPQIEIFNNHLTSQLGYEFQSKKGVKEITEVHKTSEDSLTMHLIDLLPVKFNPKTKYTHVYDEEGHLYQTYLNENKDYTLKYEYSARKQLLSIAGYRPEYVKEIFEYHPDRYIKYIYRETEDNILYKYSENYKTVSCLKFKPIKSGNKRGLKAEELLYQFYLKNFEDGTFTIQTIDAKSAKEIEKYTYLGLLLIRKDLKDSSSISYEYDDFGNIKSITEKLASGKELNYLFIYYYDDKDYWTTRLINLDNLQLLNTERNISYYN